MRLIALRFTLVFCFFAGIVYSQNEYRDSLIKISFKKKIDNAELASTYKLLSYDYAFDNADSSIFYAQRALDFASKTNNKKLEAQCIMALASANYNASNTKLSIQQYNRALNLCLEIKFYSGVAYCYSNLGLAEMDLGNYFVALKHFSKEYDYETIEKDTLGQAQSLGNSGIVYERLGNYPMALDYQLRTLKIVEKSKDYTTMANALGSIGTIYLKMKDYDRAKEYQFKSLEIVKKENDLYSEAKTLNDIGTIFQTQKKYKEAVDYYTKALTIQQKIADALSEAITLGNIGDAHQAMGQYEKALSFLERSISLKEKQGDKNGMAYGFISFSKCYYKLNDFNKSIEYANKSLTLAKEINSLELQAESHKVLSDSYELKGNNPLAYSNYKQFVSLRDSMFSQEKTKEVTQKDMEYKFEKEKAIKEAEFDMKQSLKNEEIQSQKKAKNFLFIILALSIGVIFFSVRAYKQKQKANQALEDKNNEINFQKQEIEHQKELVEDKQKEIIDSINYARRIQRSLLASNNLLNSYLKDYFIFFKPKDIVSGDFYWASILDNGNFALVTADSTGHGVPGAIMSMLNISCLNEAVSRKITAPNELLFATRKTIVETLKNDGSEEGGKDGMDCSLLSFDFKNKTLSAASANNPIWIIRNSELIEIKPDKMPVGKHDKDTEPFTLHNITLMSGDTIYTLTDGFPDQFGGENGKKYMSKKLKELLLTIVTLPLEQQKQQLDTAFTNWVGNLEQIDDVTIIGIRV